ncbi:hypothetical protein OUZ56_016461 [Daphnia magna]|uniref:Uncharacterized protein n=1 Tax=Daphnia magna TaxID=35525 RepID=A0ABR0AQR8_9CRUS|nr:hypothetical protein OUZ56_016461 [Daphnia magna]
MENLTPEDWKHITSSPVGLAKSDKFCLHNLKSLKFTATFSWSPPFFPLKNASVFYTALM